MIDIAKRISVIEALLEEGSEASLTYAALECRLTIEQVCYERLKISYDHISYDDLTKWQPRHVVQQVVEDANELAASGFTLSISKNPVPSDGSPLAKYEHETQEYVPIGEQVEIDLSKLGKMWNALSRVALHIKLPENKSDNINNYGFPDEIKSKVSSTLVELEKLKSGNLLSGALGWNYCFPCVACGTEIRRILKLLKHNQVVNCISPDCKETYLIQKEGEEVFPIRRVVSVQCEQCGNKIAIAQRLIDDLKQGEKLDVQCDSCGNLNLIKLMPVLVKFNNEEDQGKADAQIDSN